MTKNRISQTGAPNLYQCDNFRPVRAQSFKEAAQVFASREARRLFGKNAYCRTLRRDCWDTDGRNEEYEAFVGIEVEPNTTEGRNIRLVISKQTQ
jgi:hypothetical protein